MFGLWYQKIALYKSNDAELTKKETNNANKQTAAMNGFGSTVNKI